MKIHPFQAAIGFLILFLSTILLLTTTGLVPWNIWLFVWQFWPMLFVIFGAAFLMRRWNLNFFLGLPVFILIFVIVSGGLWLTWKDQYFNTDNFAEENTKGITVTRVSNEMPQKAEKAAVKIILGASNINVGSLSGLSDSFIYDGTHASNFFTLNQKVALVGDEVRVDFKASPFIKRPFNSKSVNELKLDFSEKLEYSFDIETGVSDISLNLEKLKTKKLDIDAGASKLEIKLGQGSDTDINLKSGASSLKIYIPKDSGVRVKTKSALTSNNFESQGLVNTSSGWESKNWSESKKKVNIYMKSGASKVEIVR